MTVTDASSLATNMTVEQTAVTDVLSTDMSTSYSSLLTDSAPHSSIHSDQRGRRPRCLIFINQVELTRLEQLLAHDR